MTFDCHFVAAAAAFLPSKDVYLDIRRRMANRLPEERTQLAVLARRPSGIFVMLHALMLLARCSLQFSLP